MRLDQKQFPQGTRFLYATAAAKSDYLDAVEAVIVEWSPSGKHVCLHEPAYARRRWFNVSSKFAPECVEIFGKTAIEIESTKRIERLRIR